ncbi:dopaminechrome tautomerase [Calliopsis andreniformis]|uniref:dopaminechrome tautomerase n=1 Tax=Calliopsis andreniformis TaxID=337506 RepID=UPI003FCD4C5E
MKSLTILLLLVAVTMCHEPFQVIFQWNTIDVVWPSDDERQYAVSHGDYIPANNFIAGIKFWKGKMYLSLPRWKDGVPVTLGVTSATPVNRVTAPNLEAFPSWEMQKVGDCSALQYVQSMEIDPIGRMWVLDSGRSSSLSETKTACPPRLVILNLEKDGEVLKTYEFPQHVARNGHTNLNDIVLDHEDGGLAYITDSDLEDPGIIVYSLQNNTSWKVRHDSMKAKPEAVRFMVSKTAINKPVPVDGIALSPASSKDRQVFYSPLSSFHLYSIPTSVLKSNVSNVDEHVKELGRKNSQTDGMMMSATGVLYFGLLADDAVAMWDTKLSMSFTTGQRVISRDHERMQWPDTFAFDEDGNFYCVTNSLQNVVNNRVNVSQPNYRVVRAKTGVKSYQYLENGSAPEQPEIPASVANRISFAVATGLAILLAFVVQ